MSAENNPPESQPLKPCPFCGKKPHIDDDGVGVQYFIFCDNQECVISSSYHGEQKAIEAWNRRATSEELAAVKARLTKAEAVIEAIRNCYLDECKSYDDVRKAIEEYDKEKI